MDESKGKKKTLTEAEQRALAHGGLANAYLEALLAPYDPKYKVEMYANDPLIKKLREKKGKPTNA